MFRPIIQRAKLKTWNLYIYRIGLLGGEANLLLLDQVKSGWHTRIKLIILGWLIEKPNNSYVVWSGGSDISSSIQNPGFLNVQECNYAQVWFVNISLNIRFFFWLHLFLGIVKNYLFFFFVWFLNLKYLICSNFSWKNQ